eukprot:CAMPEP_0197077706 /NCGR_PEP_ID=MMETSP1384-20130603/212750_1 /TAXON_ID=29189 /ORGANISM="Ammonia sp." /LENGTH=593 /DNA_ID=CAMNT_0042516571 /DNA_START=238 /DNA_END=2018 /DNA_ORIENTATION=-
MGLTSSMGVGNGMNGLGGGGMMGMMGGGMGMGGGMHMRGFPNRRMASMQVVHDCKMRERLMQRGMHRMGMWGGMHGGMNLEDAREIDAARHAPHGNVGRHARRNEPDDEYDEDDDDDEDDVSFQAPWSQVPRSWIVVTIEEATVDVRYYSCIVNTQQSQLQQLMQMMMMGAMANQAPITISDNTKARRRRRMGALHMEQMNVIGMKKCKMLYYAEICVTFDAVNNVISTDYTVQDRKEEKAVSDALRRVEALVKVFDEVMDENEVDWNEIEQDEEDEYFGNPMMQQLLQEDEARLAESDMVDDEDEFDDIESWTDPDPFELFVDFVGVDSETSQFANRYYDSVVFDEFEAAAGDGYYDDDEFFVSDNNDDSNEDDRMLELNEEQMRDMDTQHRIHLFLGAMTYGMHKNELIFPDEFGYELEYSYLDPPPDNDVIDYFDTFVLQWSDEKDWRMHDTLTHTKCNDVILSYVSYSICVENNQRDLGFVSFAQSNVSNEVAIDFYQQTKDIISSELDNTKLDLLADQDWSEIYEVHRNNTVVKRLCSYISMIKLCVESVNGESLLKDFAISVEYLSDKESKHVIRENNAIFNEWLSW